MLDKIVLSQDRKSAVIHFDTHSVMVSHSEGKVLDLIAMLFSPQSHIETWDAYHRMMVSSQEDTAIINIEDLKKAS